MKDYFADSDNDVGSDAPNSSQSSASDTCSTLSRLSFCDPVELPQPPPLPATKKTLTVGATFPTPARPHKARDPLFEAIRTLKGQRGGAIGFRDFRLIRRLGSGDIGSVYLCEPKGVEGGGVYAMKVVDKEMVARRKKLHRALAEKEILGMLDHPFLPTLYASFESSQFSCVLMEFCSGGDLHALRYRQPGKRFTLSSARFYAAEVLLALEYLHMLGIIYRDLKPENVLIRSDGHIMLSDFDLSLRCTSTASILSPLNPAAVSSQLGVKAPLTAPVSCFPFWFKFSSRRRRKASALAAAVAARQFVAEPTLASSCSFVGTHEYVAPEVASGEAHGNAVDWWALGVFLYELIYGQTPFKGATNEATLKNIVKRPLSFPGPPLSPLESAARDLMTSLLTKDPTKRLGVRRGAAEVKATAFFRGINFALVRAMPPPEIPGFRRTRTCYYQRSDPAARVDFF